MSADTVESLRKLRDDALSDTIVYRWAAPSLDEADLRLTGKWEKHELSCESEEKRRSRMRSARIAEKAVESYFKSLGKNVVDISITQNCEFAPDDWKGPSI